MKEGKASRTAEVAAAARVTESMRPEGKRVCYDPYAKEFLGLMFGTLRRSLLLSRFALWCVERVMPGLPSEAIGRTKYIDDRLRKCIDDGIEQLVILAAGYDARAHRMDELKGKVRVFELDFPATQQAKIAKVKKIFGHLPDNVVYVPIRFGAETLDEALSQTAYDRDLKTAFIWEGVTYYLTMKAVDDTLAFVVNNSGEGSSIIFDYALKSALDGTCEVRRVNWLLKAWKLIGGRVTSENFTFGIEEGTIGQFLAERGFSEIENIDRSYADSEYYRGLHQPRELFSLCGFVHATVAPRKQT